MRFAITLASTFFIGSFQIASAQWVPNGNGDCTGLDVACSKGPLPVKSRCFPGTTAHSAVCWDNRPTGDDPNFRENNCSSASAWCIYKSVSANQCTGGGAPGRKYDCPATTPAQQIPNAQITVFHIDRVRGAKTPWQTVTDCMKDDVCSAIASLAATQLGVPPNVMRMARVAAVVVAQGSDSEETRSTITPPQGYRVCRVNIRTLSVVPGTGDRASYLSVTAQPSSIGVYTWTPHLGVGKGRSWWEGYVTVTFVPTATPTGVCSITEAYHYSCRGASGFNGDRLACSTVDM
jgi:hypothetical protein